MSEETLVQPVKEVTIVSSPKPKIKRIRKHSVPSDPFNPKITRRLKKECVLTKAKIEGIVRHIRNVQENCLLMGEKFIERGLVEFGRELIARGFCHDNSKFYGTEWDNMAPGIPITDKPAKLKLKLSVTHHNRINNHHPEHWDGGINYMPRIALAEMVCDWKARSEEFGSSLRDWINNSATKRYGFTEKDPVYAIIMEYVDMICEKPFTTIKS